MSERMSIVWAGPYRTDDPSDDLSIGAAVYGGRPVLVRAPHTPVHNGIELVHVIDVTLGSTETHVVEIKAGRGYEEAALAAVRVAMFREARVGRRPAPAASRPQLAEAA